MENIVIGQIGDSMTNKVSEYIKKSFNYMDVPPPPPEFVMNSYLDSIEGKTLLDKFDTLAYPYKVSVINRKQFNKSTLLDDYYDAFKIQNNIRVKFISENISYDDSIYLLTANLFNKLYPEEIKKKFVFSSIRDLKTRQFLVKPNNVKWTDNETNKVSNYIPDLKNTKIRIYTIIFNESFDQGIVIANVILHGYMNMHSYFLIDLRNNFWHISSFQPFLFVKNEKRWVIE